MTEFEQAKAAVALVIERGDWGSGQQGDLDEFLGRIVHAAAKAFGILVLRVPTDRDALRGHIDELKGAAADPVVVGDAHVPHLADRVRRLEEAVLILDRRTSQAPESTR